MCITNLRRYAGAVKTYTLENAAGMRARVADIGASIIELHVPDRAGRLDDVVLGFDTVEQYRNNEPSFGCVVGRYAGRIAHGRFSIDGTDYRLATRSDGHHLHGGEAGFCSIEFDVTEDGARLVFEATSPDGDEGYPGALDVRVTYTLTDDNALVIDYRATTDRPTVLNLTNHSYFNLCGHAGGDVLGHVLQVAADRVLACDADNIPTGRIDDVAGGPLDFRSPERLGSRIPDALYQLDHSFITAGDMLERRAEVARVEEPVSGRVMTVETTEPSVQVFTPDAMTFTGPAKQRANYVPYGAICIEAQHFPNAPNEPSFPSTLLRPGDVFTSSTCYRFGTV